MRSRTRPGLLRLAICVILATSASPLVRSALADPGHQPYLNGVVLERVRGQNAATVEIRWALLCYPQLSADARYQYTITLARLTAPTGRRELTSSEAPSGTIRLRLTAGRYRADADPFFCLATVRDTKTQPERGQVFEVPDFCAWKAASIRGSTSDTLVGRRWMRLDPQSQLRPGAKLRVAAGELVTLVNNSEIAAPRRSSRVVAGGKTNLVVERGSCVSRGGWRIRLKAGRLSVFTAVDAPHEVVTDNLVLAGSGNASWSVSALPPDKTTVAVKRGTVIVHFRAGPTKTLRPGKRVTYHD